MEIPEKIRHIKPLYIVGGIVVIVVLYVLSKGNAPTNAKVTAAPTQTIGGGGGSTSIDTTPAVDPIAQLKATLDLQFANAQNMLGLTKDQATFTENLRETGGKFDQGITQGNATFSELLGIKTISDTNAANLQGQKDQFNFLYGDTYNNQGPTSGTGGGTHIPVRAHPIIAPTGGDWQNTPPISGPFPTRPKKVVPGTGVYDPTGQYTGSGPNPRPGHGNYTDNLPQANQMTNKGTPKTNVRSNDTRDVYDTTRLPDGTDVTNKRLNLSLPSSWYVEQPYTVKNRADVLFKYSQMPLDAQLERDTWAKQADFIHTYNLNDQTNAAAAALQAGKDAVARYQAQIQGHVSDNQERTDHEKNNGNIIGSIIGGIGHIFGF